MAARAIARAAIASALALMLVLAGFSVSADRGKLCGEIVGDVEQAEAVPAVAAPIIIFGVALFVCGISVSGYAASKGITDDQALNQLWVQFERRFADAAKLLKDYGPALVGGPIALALIPGWNNVVAPSLTEFILDTEGLTETSASVITYPELTTSGVTFTVSDDWTNGAYNTMNGTNIAWTQQYFYVGSGVYTDDNDVQQSGYAYFVGNGASSQSYPAISHAEVATTEPYVRLKLQLDSIELFRILHDYVEGGTGNVIVAPDGTKALQAGGGSAKLSSGEWTTIGRFSFTSVSTEVARALDATYTPVVSDGEQAISTAVEVLGTPTEIKNSVKDGKGAYAAAVVAAVGDSTVNPDALDGESDYETALGTLNVGNNDIYAQNVIGNGISQGIQNLLDAANGVLSDILTGVNTIAESVANVVTGVVEAVTAFFQPVIDFFVPPVDKSDDLGDASTGFYQEYEGYQFENFPLCLITDFQNLYEKVNVERSVTPSNYVPSHFVVELPNYNITSTKQKDLRADVTHFFSDKYFGMTLGDWTHLFFYVSSILGAIFLIGRELDIVVDNYDWMDTTEQIRNGD